MHKARRSVAFRLVGLWAATLLALSCALQLYTPDSAYAEVRRSDVVLGQTVEERGLTVAQCPSIDALYACVMDENGTIYFERDARSATQIASITKVMTALVALDAVDEGIVSLDDTLTVSAAAAEVGESSAGLQEGDKLDLNTALYALMVPSGNDAAIAIAEYVGQRMLDAGAAGDDAYQTFIDAMNAKSSDLGCIDTVYRNSHGLDSGEFAGDQHSCAYDQALVVKEAMTDERFRETVNLGDTTITVERDGEDVELLLEATDLLLETYEYACGVKTGHTDLAGFSFAGAANNGTRDLYAIVIHSSSDGQRFTDTETLFDWVYDNIVSYSLANNDETRSVTLDGQTYNAPVVAQVAHADWMDRTIAATLADPNAVAEVFALNGNVSQSFEFNDVHGNVHVGDTLGTATFYQHNEVIAQVDVVAAEDVSAPNFFEGVGIWWSRLFNNFSGGSQVAESVVLNTTPLLNDKASAAS
ncbi:MAG TPA: D-alanyl-D-alanine carboxypeptidase [Candidatus Aphodovivens excrementavium]|nr:D-alanyl-D-alanine carboxypeptidase [Candidatus Aphodovivens excrementavium]